MSDQDQKFSEDSLRIAQSSNYLAVKLHKLLAAEKQNVFFAPFSVSTALAMLFCGSEKETAAEMKQVLGYAHANIENKDVAPLYHEIISAIEKSPEDYVLSVANSLLSQKDFTIKDDYKSLLASSFSAALFDVDFRMDMSTVLDMINGWVKQKTGGMISKLLDTLDESTVVLLLNAVYFKGKWLHPFREQNTFLQYFYNQGIEENAKQVDMMHLKESFPYAEKETFKALRLPYKGNQIAMMVLLPNARDGLEELESKLTADLIHELSLEMVKTKVEVALPKFKLEYSKSLRERLQKLGLNKAFECGADLGGISNSRQLAVSDVIHKAVLDVNEEGSEAAAATAVSVTLYCLTFDPEFIVDHPFAFVIYNLQNNLILFMGRVDKL